MNNPILLHRKTNLAYCITH